MVRARKSAVAEIRPDPGGSSHLASQRASPKGSDPFRLHCMAEIQPRSTRFAVPAAFPTLYIKMSKNCVSAQRLERGAFVAARLCRMDVPIRSLRPRLRDFNPLSLRSLARSVRGGLRHPRKNTPRLSPAVRGQGELHEIVDSNGTSRCDLVMPPGGCDPSMRCFRGGLRRSWNARAAAFASGLQRRSDSLP